jgi:hypothetical protein
MLLHVLTTLLVVFTLLRPQFAKIEPSIPASQKTKNNQKQYTEELEAVKLGNAPYVSHYVSQIYEGSIFTENVLLIHESHIGTKYIETKCSFDISKGANKMPICEKNSSTVELPKYNCSEPPSGTAFSLKINRTPSNKALFIYILTDQSLDRLTSVSCYIGATCK